MILSTKGDDEKNEVMKIHKTEEYGDIEFGEAEGPKKDDVNVVVGCSTYSKYIFFSKLNYFLFPTALILYIIGELTTAIFFRFLAKYD